MKKFDSFLGNIIGSDSMNLETGATFDENVLRQAHLMSSTHKIHRNGIPSAFTFLFKPQKLVYKIAIVLVFVVSGLGVNQYFKSDNGFLAQDTVRVVPENNDTIVKYIPLSTDSLLN